MSEGLLSTLTPEERKTLEEFSTALGPVPFDDYTLARFLKARKFRLPKAVEMFQNYLKWRVDYDVDHVLTYEFPELPQVKNFYPHGFHKTDKLGRPIYIEAIGKLQIKQLFEVTNQERMLRYFVQGYERMLVQRIPACSYAAGHRVEQTLTILDMQGGGTRLMSKQVYHFVKMASNVAQDYFPELLGKMFIVNAPMLFSGAWAIIKPMLDERTRNKIAILGGKYQKEVLELVLLIFLGGRCECPGGCLFSDAGPWNVSISPSSPSRPVPEDHKEEEPNLQDLRAMIQGSMGLSAEKPGELEYAITPMNTQVEDDFDQH